MSEDGEKAGEADEVRAAADSGAAAEAPPDDGEKAAAEPEVKEPAAEPEDSAPAAVSEEDATKELSKPEEPPAAGEDDPLADFFSSRPKDDSDQKEETVKVVAKENGDLEEASKPDATDEPRARSSKSKRSSSASRSRKRGRSSTRSRSRRSRRDEGNTIEDFIKENGLDDKCARVMREMDPKRAKSIMDQGFDVRHCRNPSAVVMSRVAKMEREQGERAPLKRSFSPRRDASPRRRRSRSRRSRSPSYSSYSSSRPREKSRRKRKHRRHHRDRRHKHKRRH
mmetsp:Transcript_12117/g.27196  ORF Transcript_12117/g.27196 Transcript_12117/m.27196 type:complete len:282 (+) Transcript_12117:83-928(+)